MSRTAILVDGGFFLKRYQNIYTRPDEQTAEMAAKNLYTMCLSHLKEGKSFKNDGQNNSYNKAHDLYRIFYYDCEPLTKKYHYPISKKAINFAQSETALFRQRFFDCLKTQRKVALRMGYLSEIGGWTIRPSVQKLLLSGKRSYDSLTDEDFTLEVKQKTVDMKVGLDVASLAYKKQVEQIILISGDSDFLPAAKLARREGIDFILDPMYKQIPSDLSEHIDGLRSTCPKPQRKA
ncbi:MAG: NYN domain-containing protein [Acinetobacter sp.]|nr:MAG: NYN domain-containing protein [Acinetobacter sp.]